MTQSPFDHPRLSVYLGDDETAGHVSAEAERDAILAIGRTLCESLVAQGLPGRATADAMLAQRDARASGFTEQVSFAGTDALDPAEAADEWHELISWVDELDPALGVSSLDVIDAGLMLRLKPLLAMLERRMSALTVAFEAMAGRFGAEILVGTTTKGATVHIRVGERIASWREPLDRQRERIAHLSRHVCVFRTGGAPDSGDTRSSALRADLAGRLGLSIATRDSGRRAALSELAEWLSIVTNVLGTFGQDVALMAHGDALTLSADETSPEPDWHSPVAAEAIVALARLNAALLAAMDEALAQGDASVRSLAGLELKILPHMATATGAALRISQGLTDQIERLGA